MSALVSRIKMGLEFALIISIILFVFYLIDRFIFNKKIGYKKYSWAALILAVILDFGLPPLLINKVPVISPVIREASKSNKTATGLDKPFLPPIERDVEKFPFQLNEAILKLNEAERKQISIAIGFLSYCFAGNIAENDQEKLNKMSESDLAAQSLVKLYRYAQKNGASMTLRKYVELSEEFKRQKPEWWKQYQAFKK